MRTLCELVNGRHTACGTCGLSCAACACRYELDADVAVMDQEELRAKVMQQRRYIDVLVDSERQRRRSRPPSFAPLPPRPTPLPDAPAVHALLYGFALCAIPGIPRDWPQGHTWVRVDEPDKVTCEGCKDALVRVGRRT